MNRFVSMAPAAMLIALGMAAPAAAQDFSYNFNTQANVDSFKTRFLHGLANRATFAGSAYMRVALAPNDSNFQTVENLTEDTIIESLSNAPQAAELVYRIRFSSNFEFVRQGKLPGIASFTPHYGGNANDPVAPNAWSYRTMWFPGTPTIKRPDMYLYDQARQTGDTGEHNTASGSYPFVKNQWHVIKMVLILNTVNGSTGNANSDGKSELWMDGVRVVCRDGKKFRGNNSSNNGRVGKLAFHLYHGGGRSTTEMPTSGSTYVDFDYFNYRRLGISGINRSC